MNIAVNTTNARFISHINSPIVLDLLHIHSYKEGEGRGKKLMLAFKDIQEELNIPGVLFTEQYNVTYFTQYGFEDLGELGINNEHLMKLPV